MRLIALVALFASLAPAADNVLTPEERANGWILLFDGKSMRGWRDPTRLNQPGDAWEVKDGTLKTRLKPRIAEDLVTQDSFADFELVFDWRVSPGGNTGLKYRIQQLVFVDESKIQPGPGGFEGILGREIASGASNRATLAPDSNGFVYSVGFEMQLIDDLRHPDAKRDKRHTTGALYSMIAPSATAARPAGEWNTSRIVAIGPHVEHWINGVKVLEGSLQDEAIAIGVKKRWAQVPSILNALLRPKPEGPIALQHHGDEVWFRNIKIRRLPARTR